MPRPKRLTRPLPARITDAGHRRLRRFAEETGLESGEALSFLLENLDVIADEGRLRRRLAQHKTMLARRETAEDPV